MGDNTGKLSEYAPAGCYRRYTYEVRYNNAAVYASGDSCWAQKYRSMCGEQSGWGMLNYAHPNYTGVFCDWDVGGEHVLSGNNQVDDHAQWAALWTSNDPYGNAWVEVADTGAGIRCGPHIMTTTQNPAALGYNRAYFKRSYRGYTVWAEPQITAVKTEEFQQVFVGDECLWKNEAGDFLTEKPENIFSCSISAGEASSAAASASLRLPNCQTVRVCPPPELVMREGFCAQYNGVYLTLIEIFDIANNSLVDEYWMNAITGVKVEIDDPTALEECDGNEPVTTAVNKCYRYKGEGCGEPVFDAVKSCVISVFDVVVTQGGTQVGSYTKYFKDSVEVTPNTTPDFTGDDWVEVCCKDKPADLKSLLTDLADLLTKDRLIVPERLVKRTIKVPYDNGTTPGSSSNTTGGRQNLVYFNQAFTVLGWYVNGLEYGAGEALGPFTSWTPQLEGWAAFKAANDPNKSTAAFAFKPAPTWRYCELTTCDPNAVYGPLRLKRDDGEDFTVYPVRSLASSEYTCASRYSTVDCYGNKKTIWCDENDVEIDEPEDAKCYVPISFPFADYIYDVGAPVCTERVRELCDVVDGVSVGEFTLVISDCDGVRTRERWTTASYVAADNPDDLVAYVVQGSASNCLTLEPYVEPPQPCENFEITELFEIQNKTAGLRNREWTNLGPANTFSSDPTAPEAYLEAFDFSVAADIETVVTSNVFALNDTSNTASILDYQIREGWICVSEAFEVEWGTNSEGYIGVWLGLCGGQLERVISYAKAVGLERTPRITIPKGIHKIRLDNLDWGGSNSNWTTYEIIAGVAVARNALGDSLASTTAPREVCKKVKVCKPSGTLIGLLSKAEIDPANCYECSIACSPGIGVWGGC